MQQILTKKFIIDLKLAIYCYQNKITINTCNLFKV